MPAKKVILVTTAMLSFISFWRAAAIVLCDLASSAYYIGGISEQAIGKAAPWFILAVMLFSYGVRALYIESSSMFVRGGVYRVVKEAMGGTLAKLSVSALMFDYVLTGPISAVSAGQYLVGLLNQLLPRFHVALRLPPNLFALGFALLITIYFWWQNVKGLEESSDKALKIMGATTVMAVILLGWSLFTLTQRKFQSPPLAPHFSDPAWGWLYSFRHSIRPLGFLGIMMAFGHTVLAMSGEETLAQVYREMEAPKLQNLQKAGFIIFIYSLLLTSLVSFLAVMIIPDKVRLNQYSDNLISGLTMYLAGPETARLFFQGFVVFVGFLILSGGVNTSIVGSNGVLNRVGEDGVLPDWFRAPHPHYGTTYRLINLSVLMQIVTLLLCRGNVYVLGEAYAFGVVWSFVFKSLAVLVLRFTEPEHREWKVPGNLRFGKTEIPLGLVTIFLVLAATAAVNLLTKRVATIAGSLFTFGFFVTFIITEKIGARRSARNKSGKTEQHLDRVNVQDLAALTAEACHLTKPQRLVVAVKDANHLDPLKLALENTPPESTDVVVMTATIFKGMHRFGHGEKTPYQEELLFANIIGVAEKIGHSAIPIVVPSNDVYLAMARVAYQLKAQELVVGPSVTSSHEKQKDRLTKAWHNARGSDTLALKIRILGPGINKTESVT